MEDVMDKICALLKIRDLLKVGLVSRAWNGAMSRELARRGQPERALIPDIYDRRHAEANFHVLDFLNERPHVSILFVGPSFREREDTMKRAEEKILQCYDRYFNKYVIAVGVDQCVEDRRDIMSCQGLSGPSNGILGLFLPLRQNLKIIVAATDKYHNPRTVSERSYRRFLTGLLPDNTPEGSTLLIFANPFTNLDKLMRHIKENLRPRTYALWGGSFDDDLLFMAPSDGRRQRIRKAGIVGVCINGPNIESWSTVIDCRLHEGEFTQRLQRFKDGLTLRRHTVGLACGPRYVENYLTDVTDFIGNGTSIMGAVKSVFPSVPFIGVFNYGYHPHFGVDSTSDDPNQVLATEMSLSLLIITYDHCPMDVPDGEESS